MTARPAGRGLRETLSNPKADRIKQVAALAGRSASAGTAGSAPPSAAKSARERSGLFLVEGPQGVRELVAHRADAVRDLYVSDAARAAHPGIVDAALEAGLFVHPVTDEVSAAISGDSQGIAAVAAMWDVTQVYLGGSSYKGSLYAEAPQAAPAPRSRLVAILADVRDPGNAGTAIRVADAAGAGAVILAGDSVDVFSPKVVRATAGSLFHVPVMRGVSVADAVAAARAAGLTVLAADGAGEHALFDTPSIQQSGPLRLEAPTAWLFGNEAHGLTPDQLRLADAAVRIPIYGAAESLNLAAAVAVCLYASANAHSGT